MIVAWVPPGEISMSGNPTLVLFVALALIAARQGVRAIDAASRLGRRRQFGDIRRAVRPSQSQVALRSQRHRQRREYPAASPQPAGAGNLLWLGRHAGAACTARAVALYRRVAADHQCAPRLPAKTAGSASGATGGEQFYGDLPGLLELRFRLHQNVRFNVRRLRGTIFYCRTYARLTQRSRVLKSCIC